MSTAREREAKTIKKDIGGNASLTPAINAQGLSSFSYARPGEVGYDRYAGAGLRQLAANLSSIEPSIAHADCAPDAQILASLLRRSSKPPKKILTVDYEPVTKSEAKRS